MFSQQHKFDYFVVYTVALHMHYNFLSFGHLFPYHGYQLSYQSISTWPREVMSSVTNWPIALCYSRSQRRGGGEGSGNKTIILYYSFMYACNTCMQLIYNDHDIIINFYDTHYLVGSSRGLDK